MTVVRFDLEQSLISSPESLARPDLTCPSPQTPSNPPTPTPPQRLAFFLATTRNLAEQQCARVRRATCLSAKLCVGMELDMWSKEKWQALFRRHPVIVCTAQILVNLLDKGSEYMTMARINVLILDECHKAHRNHPYTKVMSHYDRASAGERPRVFGMTVRALRAA